MSTPGSAAGSVPVTRREIFGWCMYDFANSSYTTVIVTVLFSVYFEQVVAGGAGGQLLWGTGILVSNALMVLLSPLIGAVADERGRKPMLFVMYAVCVAFTALLYFAGPGQVMTGLAFFIISNTAYGLGENISYSFLPEISRPDNIGRVSGYGWALGYLGGLLSLALCFPLVSGGITAANASNVRLVPVVVAIFFGLAAIPTFLLLRERRYGSYGGAVVRLKDTLAHLGRYRELAKFLVSFFFFISGLSIVIAFASIFATRNLAFGPTDLLVLFVILQVSSSVGAFVFGLIQDRIGPRTTLQTCLVIWLVVIAGVFLTETRAQFYVVGNLAGLALGATQSASRTVVGQLAPLAKSAEIFGYMGVFWKLAQGWGSISYPAAAALLASDRLALTVPFVYFLVGLVALQFVRLSPAVASRRQPPSGVATLDP